MSIITILFMGLFVSLTSVFIGLGGGILLVPLLPDFFGLSTHEAVATSLLTIFFVVSNNTYKFHQEGLVRWPVVLMMGPISAVTAIIAAQVSQKVDARVILYALVFLLILVAIKTLFSSLLQKNYEVKEELDAKQKAYSLVGGAIAGLTSGFAGVGSGVILSPVMILLKSVSGKQLSPTANANMVFATCAASLCYLASGYYVKWN
ncbi:MAG: sulfite exporter TauE/SafE family protein, partial [Bdellovibrionales bacterium]|nr:sulfite exporter TauE/SafE family protein [Bdellovibrionales bacterium]